MLNFYQRRAFLALAVFAIEPLAAPAARADEPETLWEALNHVERASNGSSDTSEPGRVPLGAVPGFTLPAQDRVGDAGSESLSKKKKVYRGPLAPMNRLWDQLMAATGSNIDVKGDSTVTFRKDSVAGGSSASQAFQDSNYIGQGSNGLYTQSSLNVDATMFKYFHYNSVISNSPYRSPGQNKAKLDYNTKKTRFQVGDINVNFQGNSLIDFSRYLSGVELDNEWTPHFKTKMLASTIKAETRTSSIQGNNSTGPYSTAAGQIVDGSAQVRVDNRDMVQGKDYTLDPNTGLLNFLNGNVILQSQTIAITYEAQNDAASLGTILGLRTQYTAHGANSVGITYVTQQTPRVAQYTARKQIFQGQELALAAYTLDSPIDTTKPFSVTADGVPLVRGTLTTGDYFIDSAFPNVIHLRNPVSSLSNVIITYYPLDTAANAGSRSVMGVDSHVGLGRWGSVTVDTALSGLSLSNNNYTGKAAQVRLDLTPMRGLTTRLTLRDVGAAYSSIQSPGFNRNEKSVEIAADYTPFKKLHLNVEAEEAKRPSYSSVGSTGTSAFAISSLGNDTYKQYTLGASYDLLRDTKITASRNNLGTQYLAGGDSTSTSDNLSLNWGRRSISATVGLIHSVSDTNSPNGLYGLSLTPTTTPGGAYTALTSTVTERAAVQWQALKWLNLNTSLSENAINNSGSAYAGTLSHTNAQNRQVSVHVVPPLGKKLQKIAKNLDFTYSLGVSDTGTPPGTAALTTTGTTATGTTAAGATATGTTTGGTTPAPVGGLTSGGLATRSLFAPWITPATLFTRDSVGSTSSGFGTTTTVPSAGLVGGGINSSLGAAGNYSGFLGNSTANTGVTSLTGRTTTNHLGMNYVVSSALQMNMSYDFATSTGDYQYNSDRKSATANLNWVASDRFQVNAGLNIMHVNYTGGQGATRTNTLQFGFSGRPFGNKLTLTAGYQATITNSSLNLATTAASILTGTATPTSLTTSTNNNNSNVSSLSARIDIPVSARHALFVDWASSLATGYLGNTQTNLRFGLDTYLNRFLKFSLGWQTLNSVNSNTTLTNYNYHNSTVLAEFGVHF